MCAAAKSYPFTLVEVRGLPAPEENLRGGELILGGRLVGIENKDIQILEGGFKRGDHALRGGGTWTSYAGPDRDSDRDSDVTVDRSLFVDRPGSIP